MLPTAAAIPLLRQYQPLFGPVVPIDLNGPDVCPLDFTARNPLLVSQSLAETSTFERLVNQMLGTRQATVGIGGYLENRIIYRRSPLFSEMLMDRSIHLGIDIWLPAGTPVLAPLDAVVHSFRDNTGFGDYGPTIILRHQLASFPFYTLYGHLSRSSFHQLEVNKAIKQGEIFATVGPYPENGDWPPHLHFQIITDMKEREGDFPGVCSIPEKEKFAGLCPDPNLILQCRHLAAF